MSVRQPDLPEDVALMPDGVAPVATSNGHAARFVLIDHSILSEGGHYLEYARQVLAAAQSLGYKPILATNRVFPDQTDLDWPVHRLYVFDVWGRRPRASGGWRWPGRLMAAGRRARFRMRFWLRYSPWGLLWVAAHDPTTFLYKRSLDPAQLIRWALLLLPFIYALNLAHNMVAGVRTVVGPIWRHYPGEIARAIGRLAFSLVLPLVLLWRLRTAVVAAYVRRQRLEAFARATQQLSSRVELGPDDVVFIPTLSDVDMVGLGRALQRETSLRRPSWHVLFRRNIYEGRERDYAAQDEGLAPVRTALLSILDRAEVDRLHFYTDTETLTRQYDRLNVAPFRTLPIPVNPRLTSADRLNSGGTLRVGYVGDARSEKGYHHLPALVGAMFEGYVATRRVRFVLQSNFAFADARADSATVIARQQLASYLPEHVEVIDTPLSSAEYCELLQSLDVLLIPYDAARYYARSSGVLVEALTAGIPVVVPGGSWMADQIQAESRRYHLRLAASAPRVRTLVGLAMQWHSRGNLEHPYRDNILTFGGPSSPAETSLPVDSVTSHLLLRFKFAPGTLPDTYAKVQLEQIDRAGRSSHVRRSSLLRATDDGFCTALIALDPRCERVRLGIHDPFHEAAASVTGLQVDWLALGSRTEHLPIASIGATYTRPEDLSDALREVVDSYPYYRESAQAFARQWVQYHNPRRLVSDLRSAGLTDNADRQAFGVRLAAG